MVRVSCQMLPYLQKQLIIGSVSVNLVCTVTSELDCWLHNSDIARNNILEWICPTPNIMFPCRTRIQVHNVCGQQSFLCAYPA
jgi:hypothetical protein